MASASDLPTTQHLLDALEGVAYLVDPGGRILACGRPNWDAFAGDNGTAHLNAEAVIGTRLLDHVHGEEVRVRYGRWLEDLCSGRSDGIELPFRCDAPDVRREFRLSIRPIRPAGHTVAVLFHSLVISETVRPPVPLFDLDALVAHFRGDTRPIIAMCSFCHAVRPAAADPGAADWMPPEDYYRTGGSSDVRISHGICNACAVSLPQGYAA